MSSQKADLLLHPVRLRIASELLRRQATPRELALALPDVPQATLYRQINTLLEGGVLEIVAEIPVNGSVERTFRLAPGAERLSPEELRAATPDEHKQYFNIFVASLIETFSRYVQHANKNAIGQDGMSYNQGVIYLTPAERAHLQEAFTALLAPVFANMPAPDRQRYTLASIVIPDERDPK